MGDDLFVPESNDMIAHALQYLCTGCIGFLASIVPISIKFDDKFLAPTNEINFVCPNGVLTDEFQSLKSPVPQQTPHDLLGRGRVLAVCTGTLKQSIHMESSTRQAG